MFATKATIPTGEVRSLYVGPGNTSFFVAMGVFGVMAGIFGFRYLYSVEHAELVFGLPFSKRHLFWAEYGNMLLIFVMPCIVCRFCFFQFAVSMGYVEFGADTMAMWQGVFVCILGFLFFFQLTVFAMLVVQNMVYTIGVLLFLVFAPIFTGKVGDGILAHFFAGLYCSVFWERIKEYLSPITLYQNAAGISDYVDGSDWKWSEHASYIWVMISVVLFLTVLNSILYRKRPVEPKQNRITFHWVEILLRYICVLLGTLWLVNGLQFFALNHFSVGLAIAGAVIGVFLMHGIVGLAMHSTGKHLFLELGMAMILLLCFFIAGKETQVMPEVENLSNLSIVLPAIDSGADSDRALSEMTIEGDALKEIYEWIDENCVQQKEVERNALADMNMVLVRYEELSGKEKYCRYYISKENIARFQTVFAKEAFRESMFPVLALQNMNYFEIHFDDGVEEYQLDLNEAEKEALLEAYREDFAALSFTDFANEVPVGRLDLCSTKNQEDVSGYVYPGFVRVGALLEAYGMRVEKGMQDYDLTKIVVNEYEITPGLLYEVKGLTDRSETDSAEFLESMAETLHSEELCVNRELADVSVNELIKYQVYYRDSEGKTVGCVECLEKIEK